MGNRHLKKHINIIKSKSFIAKDQNTSDDSDRYKIIGDNFQSFSELENALRKAGLEACQLIIGIDFTKSNTWQGGAPFFLHKNLHTISGILNLYQQVLTLMCQALGPFDDDQMIDAYGFGDTMTTNKSVFPLLSTIDGSGHVQEQACYKLEGVLDCYNKIAPFVKMSGPTSFAPIIRKAIELVKVRNTYHILLIIADGAVDDIDETTDVIIDASKYPLSIVCIGIGKGPWEKMKDMDDNIPERDFDNFQFVNFYESMERCENAIIEFTRQALMEIPDQYSYIKKNILKYY